MGRGGRIGQQILLSFLLRPEWDQTRGGKPVSFFFPTFSTARKSGRKGAQTTLPPRLSQRLACHVHRCTVLILVYIPIKGSFCVSKLRIHGEHLQSAFWFPTHHKSSSLYSAPAFDSDSTTIQGVTLSTSRPMPLYCKEKRDSMLLVIRNMSSKGRLGKWLPCTLMLEWLNQIDPPFCKVDTSII